MDLFLRIHQDVTGVLARIRVLHIRQLQCAVVLKGTLAMVKRKQVQIFVPLDGVVGVANDAAVNEHVSPRDGSEVFHWADTGRTC